MRVSLVLFVYVFHLVKSYNILGILPHESKSHSALMSSLMNELIDRGHSVTLISYSAQSEVRSNFREIILHSRRAKDNHKMNVTLSKYTNLETLVEYNMIREVNLVHDLAKDTCEDGIFQPEIHQLIQNHWSGQDRFDLVLIQAFNNDCFLGLVHRLKVPFLQLSTTTMFTWFHSRFGVTFNPAFNPNIWMGTTGTMNFYERMVNMLVDVYARMMYFYVLQPRDYELVKRAFGDDLPPLEKIAHGASVILEHTHFSLMPPRALNPGHIQICGFHIPKIVKPLNEVFISHTN